MAAGDIFNLIGGIAQSAYPRSPIARTAGVLGNFMARAAVAREQEKKIKEQKKLVERGAAAFGITPEQAQFLDADDIGALHMRGAKESVDDKIAQNRYGGAVQEFLASPQSEPYRNVLQHMPPEDAVKLIQQVQRMTAGTEATRERTQIQGAEYDRRQQYQSGEYDRRFGMQGEEFNRRQQVQGTEYDRRFGMQGEEFDRRQGIQGEEYDRRQDVQGQEFDRRQGVQGEEYDRRQGVQGTEFDRRQGIVDQSPSSGSTITDRPPSWLEQRPRSDNSPSNTIMNYLINKGLTPQGAAGFVGNMKHESGVRADQQEINPIAGRGGYGLAQWTGPRRVALERFAQQNGRSVSDVQTQLDFLISELDKYPATKRAVTDPNRSAADVAEVVLRDYERPANPNATVGRRRSSAAAAFEGYSGRGTVSDKPPSWLRSQSDPDVDVGMSGDMPSIGDDGDYSDARRRTSAANAVESVGGEMGGPVGGEGSDVQAPSPAQGQGPNIPSLTSGVVPGRGAVIKRIGKLASVKRRTGKPRRKVDA